MVNYDCGKKITAKTRTVQNVSVSFIKEESG